MAGDRLLKGRTHPCVRPFAAALLLALAACDQGPGSDGPGAVSEGEAQALDEAAEMLDARQLPPEAIPELPEGPGEGSEQGDAPQE
ncbi:MAG: hypothetical protein AAGK02_06135 [Pseudomonadota bacterium]